MPPLTPDLAKLSRPRLYRVSPRERLFRLLDERREHPVVWVAGAPGTGKSTLVASYLEARKLGGIWYQVDAGDTDPATFFYYLGVAAADITGGKLPPLPLLTEEYRANLERFARRWFRELCARMPVGAVVVFDNMHAATPTSDVRAALSAGLEETPVGVNVIIISRAEPPPECARLIANRTITRIGAADLRFTRDEAATLLATQGEIDARTLDQLYERSDGWAAGLILMYEHASRGDAAVDGGRLATPEAVFAYFAGEIFNRMAREDQRVLVLCALPERISEQVAVALAETPGAGVVLEYGFRRHLFITRRDGAVPVYEFHALFREFLLARARALMSGDELADHRRRAAQLIEASGTRDGIFELYGDAGDWADAIRVTLQDAADMLTQGRFRPLLERIDALPGAERSREPWLAYWAGAAWVNFDPLAARSNLERAYDGFAARGDARGEIEAAEAIVVSHYLARDDWRPVDRWIAVMERSLSRAAFATADAEARALSSLAIALVYRQPGHPLLAMCFERLRALLDAVADKNLKVATATRLIDGLNKAGSLGESQRVAAHIRAVIADPDVRPLTGAWCRVWLANLYYFQARLGEMDAMLADALAITKEEALGFLVPVIDLFRCWSLLARGDLKEAGQVIAQLEATLDPSRKLDVASLHFLRTWFAAARGEVAQAEREGRAAAQLSLETGSVTSTVICHTARLLSLDQTGQHATAAAVLERMRNLLTGVEGGVLRYHTALWEAYVKLRAGDATFQAPLAEALALGRREGYLNHYLWWPPMMSALAAIAIEQGIEVDYVRQLVRARGLLPDEAYSSDAWPWPLRIHALGRFAVVRDGEPIAFRGKAQKKPMELLKALVALGGEGVEASRLAAILWPDAAGDAAKVSFDSTLYRLRKLLDNDAALALQEGKLSLDRRQCWVDVWAFERVARDVDAFVRAPVTASGPHDPASAIVARLLGAYPGHLLATDEDLPWLMPLRDRLRSKLVRTVLALGKTLQAAQRWEDAIGLYQRALELDNLAEDLYRSLMVCCREVGRLSDALQAYRRCRELLSVVLGLQPSAETEAVRRSLANTGTSGADA